VISATVNGAHDQVLASLSYEFVDSYDDLGRKKRFALGGNSAVGLLQTASDTGISRYGVMSLSAIGRLQAGAFFFDLSPVFEAGYGNGWHGDIGGIARVGLQVMGRLQVRLLSPRWSVIDQARFNGEVVGIELGFRCWPGSKVCF
jgi:hypothetical protein